MELVYYITNNSTDVDFTVATQDKDIILNDDGGSI